MKILILVPYSPWPADTGTKVEMMKHLDTLNAIGDCTIVSAKSRPVGFGWNESARNALKSKGFEILFREDQAGRDILGMLGMVYAGICKSFKLEKAFGHSNPYHRYAFSQSWLKKVSSGFDLCVMQYGFWAASQLACPKAVVLHELLSNYHWGGHKAETRELKTVDLLCVVGNDERDLLRERGINNVLWSPPAVAQGAYPVNDKIALIGTKAPQNLEGARWVERGRTPEDLHIHVFGNLADVMKHPMFIPVGRYEHQNEPYQKCGIVLLTRPDRPGLQIKAVEALAHGRAIIARRGSMRGLPGTDMGWITVDSPSEMLEAARRLQINEDERVKLASEARTFYKKHLDHNEIITSLREAYLELVK